MKMICQNPICNKIFQGRPSTRKYCSRSCSTTVNNSVYPRSKSKTLNCSECGVELTTTQKRTKCGSCYFKSRSVCCVVCSAPTKTDYKGCLNCIKKISYRVLIMEARECLGGKCVKCGTTENLQFDHVDPATKLFRITKWRKVKASVEEFWVEIAKCQLLCRPHHQEKTSVDLTGVGNGRNVLRELDIKYIRGLRQLGHSSKAIAAEFDVTPHTINAILRGATWTHV